MKPTRQKKLFSRGGSQVHWVKMGDSTEVAAVRIPNDRWSGIYGMGYTQAYNPGSSRYSRDLAAQKFPDVLFEYVDTIHSDGLRDGVMDKANGFPPPKHLEDFYVPQIQLADD